MTDFADRHLAELDDSPSNAAPRLLIDHDDGLHLFWTDDIESESMAISERDADGTWRVRDVASQYLDPSDADFQGSLSLSWTWQFGATWLPDGKLAVSFADRSSTSLWYAEGF